MKSILDPTFRYTPAADTDLRKTFARVRREQERAKRDSASQMANVYRNFENRRRLEKK